jgi:hypothetical protein
MATPMDFNELINAVLLLAETKDACPFIAVISDQSADRFLCFGKKEELIEGLASEFWKQGGREGAQAHASAAPPLTVVRSLGQGA